MSTQREKDLQVAIARGYTDFRQSPEVVYANGLDQGRHHLANRLLDRQSHHQSRLPDWAREILEEALESESTQEAASRKCRLCGRAHIDHFIESGKAGVFCNTGGDQRFEEDV